jgi:patatin-like phospholipase/acyl hydrolase
MCLDGGGIKGTFTAAVLAELEKMTGKRIADHFGLITGTSTGGLIAIALGLGVSAQEVLAFYEKRGLEIFPLVGLHRRIDRNVRWWYKPKFSALPLQNAIASVLGNRLLGESTSRLAIPTFNAVNGDIYIFKTAHYERFKQDYKEPAVNVALATSAAPTYFPAFRHENGLTFVDGGIWANTPVTVGIIEALAVLGIDLADIELLSIGTTDSPFYIDDKQRSGGLLNWNKDLILVQSQAQSAGAVAQAKLLLRDRFVRVNATTHPGRFSLDNAAQIAELKALGITEARHRENQISQRFLDVLAEPFVPAYTV